MQRFPRLVESFIGFLHRELGPQPNKMNLFGDRSGPKTIAAKRWIYARQIHFHAFTHKTVQSSSTSRFPSQDDVGSSEDTRDERKEKTTSVDPQRIIRSLCLLDYHQGWWLEKIFFILWCTTFFFFQNLDSICATTSCRKTKQTKREMGRKKRKTGGEAVCTRVAFKEN